MGWEIIKFSEMGQDKKSKNQNAGKQDGRES